MTKNKRMIKEASQYTFGSEFGLDDVVDDVFSAKDVEKVVTLYVKEIYEPLNKYQENIDIKPIIATLTEMIGDVPESYDLEDYVVTCIEAFDTMETQSKLWQDDFDEALLTPLIEYLNGMNEFFSSDEYLQDSWEDNSYIAFEGDFAFEDGRGRNPELPKEVDEALEKNNLTVQDLSEWIKDNGSSYLKTGVSSGYSAYKDLDEAIVLMIPGDLGEDEQQVDGLRDTMAALTKDQETYVEKKVEGTIKGEYLYIYLNSSNVTYYIEWDDIEKDFLEAMGDR
jgi:hypothetical protein